MTGTKSLNTEAYFRLALRLALALGLVAPYLIWLLWIPHWSWPEVREWLPLALTSLGQALYSSLFSVLFGFLLFLGAQSWTSSRGKKICEMALLLPNMTPPLFLVLSLLAWVTPWAAFPYGIGAVIVAHVLMNSGLIAIALDRLVHTRIGGMAETAWTLGVSRATFWRRIGWPYLKYDFACLFLFVFSICFTSFSIPLVLGGERWSTLEVAIFDTIRMDGRWDKAIILAAGQSIFLLLLAISLPRAFWPAKPQRRPMHFLAVDGLSLFVFLPALILMVGWILGISSALKFSVHLDIMEALLTSAALGLTVGIFQLILFLQVAYVSPHMGLHKFLNGYMSPSPAITGFAMLLIPGSGGIFNFLKLAAALTLISFPLLYRWIVHSALDGLHNQVVVARTLGAKWSGILFEVVWPQTAAQILRASGLAALWGASDFALSGIVGGDLKTLPLMMDSLMGNYHFESAQLLMIPLLLVGLGLYGLFMGAARYVTG
jgi:thiamine transport system permease protein